MISPADDLWKTENEKRRKSSILLQFLLFLHVFTGCQKTEQNILFIAAFSVM